MMFNTKRHLDVLCNYHDDFVAGEVVSLGAAGGLSGASFWKIHGRRGTYCLRRWNAAYPTLERLQFIHAVQWHANQEGFSKFPLPVETLEHLTFVADDQYFWQLEPWLPGRASFVMRPTTKRLVAAMVTLAEFHQAVRTFPLEVPYGTSPLLRQQETFLQAWNEDRFQCLRQAITNSKKRNADHKILFLSRLSDSETCGMARRMADVAVLPETAFDHQQSKLRDTALRIWEATNRVHSPLLRQIKRCSQYDTALQPCLGDIHAGHVFFEKNHVRGLIDFESLCADSVVTDMARLLGSMVGGDPFSWVLGMNAYQSVRRLTDSELEMAHLCRKSHLVITALRWLEYIFAQTLPIHCSSTVERHLLQLQKTLDC